MSSSLIKAGYVSANKDGKRVIDSNQAISDRLKMLSEILDVQAVCTEDFADDFSEGLDVEQVNALLGDAEAEETVSTAAEDANVIIEQAQEQAQQMLEDANQQAESILANAQKEAERIRNDAYAIGREEGQQAGYQEGLEKTTAIENELNEKIRQVQEDYDRQISELEPQFIELLTNIYSHVFGVDMSDRTDVIMYLLNDAIRNADGAHEFFVHVSKSDYEYVCANKAYLSEGLASTCNVEVIEDITLGQGECFVETQNGIFDCSLGTELYNLKKELVLMSYKS